MKNSPNRSRASIQSPMWKTVLAFLWLSAILGRVSRVFAAKHEIPNPISTPDFEGLVLTITRTLTPLALIVAVIAIIIVGFQIVVAAGSGKAEAAAKHKTTLLWVLVGTAIIAGAALLAQAVVNTIRGL
ncbi:MAG: hypothetical protein HY472_01465 [Candidatus Sungbacteria bacterium]|nr:hypothetical protein [Candidatus Sungbacteria bacterium]